MTAVAQCTPDAPTFCEFGGGGPLGKRQNWINPPKQAELVLRCPDREVASPLVSQSCNPWGTGKMFNSQPSESRKHLTYL